MEPTPPPALQQPQPPIPFWKQHFNVLFSLFILFIVLIPILLLFHFAASSPFSRNTPTPTPTNTLLIPTGTPITAQNATTTLQALHQTIQSTLDQAGIELTLASQINASQDAVLFPISPGENVDSLKKEAADLVSQRITTLNQLSSYINASSLLTPQQKTEINIPIQNTLSLLEATQTRIQTFDTTATQITNDVKSLQNYKIYSNMLPSTHSQIALTLLLKTSQELSNTYKQLLIYSQELHRQNYSTLPVILALNTINNHLTIINSHLSQDFQLTNATDISPTTYQVHFVKAKADMLTLFLRYQKIQTQIENIQAYLASPQKLPTGTPALKRK